jgi:hypothetical protein
MSAFGPALGRRRPRSYGSRQEPGTRGADPLQETSP